MVSPRWRKVLRDLWNNKARTALVILSIAVGVAAIGVVTSTFVIITRELPGTYARANPTSANIFAAPFGDDMIQVIRNMGILRDVEGRFTFRASMKTGTDTDQDLLINVLPDFNDIRINKIWPETGAWPPGKGEILIERSSLPLVKSKVGDSISIQTSNGRQRTLKISGLAHDLNKPAGTFTNQVTGYITFDTLEILGYPKAYNELLMTVDGNPPDLARVKEVANMVGNKIVKGGHTVYSTVLANPGRLWFEAYLTPMASILGILGIILLLMSALLVVNTISALMAQQIRQIGIMKAVGGRTSQIVWMYMFSMLIIGFSALVIAVPLGNLWTRSSVSLLAKIINFDISNMDVPLKVFYVQFALSILVPLAAASFPIFSGARVTVREAISDYGLSNVNFGRSFFDRVIGTIRGLPRPLLLSLRNTFRQKGRLVLTLATLSIASAIFIAVLSVYASLTVTMNQALNYYGFDLAVQFSRSYRVEQISNVINSLPGVVTAETWDTLNGRITLPDGSESDPIMVIAPAANTSLIKPNLLAGRWLKPDDQNAVVINSDVLKVAPGIRVGDKITLTLNEKKNEWTVVGTIRSVLTGPNAYTNYSYFSRLLGRYGEAAAVYVKVQNPDDRYQMLMARLLEDHFETAGMRVGSTLTVAELRRTALSQYNVIFIFLLLMVILLTIVGGLGLTGTMSLNVLERTREIGVLRAVGASNSSVLQIIISEGILIGVISWLIGMVLAIPLAWLLGRVIGSGFLREPLLLTYSISGVLIWFFIVLLLATIASYIPGRRAVSLTVRDILSYE